jgi:hypothetical protein
MILLCAGVIIASSTFRSFAASYDVTAIVPAALITSPAQIVAPYHQQHITDDLTNVTGTCPTQSYVKLFRNSEFSGVSQCSDDTFEVQTLLTLGENLLEAKVYNLTDQEGPSSSPIIVYHDETTVAPPADPPKDMPVTIAVASVEDTAYKKQAVSEVSDNPTITGYAPPFADVVVTFHSDPLTCKTKANAMGWWACTLQVSLPEGTHQVDIVATTVDGVRLTFPSFHIKVVASKMNLRVPAAPGEAPLRLTTDYRYRAGQVDKAFKWELNLAGSSPPYTVTVDWKDGKKTILPNESEGSFTLTHTFSRPGIYQPFFKVTDQKGKATSLQLSAVVWGLGLTGVTTNSGPTESFLAWFRQYIWLVWPVYGAVALMAVSFWLGEQEVIRRLSEKRRRTSHKTARS